MNDKLEEFKAVHAHIALQLRDSVEVKVREVVVFANLDPAKQITRTDQEGSYISPLVSSSRPPVISSSPSYPFIFLLTQTCRGERPCEEAQHCWCHGDSIKTDEGSSWSYLGDGIGCYYKRMKTPII